MAEGADILDIGGESTRPGAEPVGEAEELRQVLPVVEGLVGAGVGADTQISIDTSKAAVARAALAAGASLVNDVSALRADPEMARRGSRGRGAVLPDAHAGRAAHDAAVDRAYENVVDDVKAFLEERMGFAVRAGIARGAAAARPWHRLRQDPRAQPGAAATSR